MPCSKYSGGKRRLCYATKGFKDFSKINKYGGTTMKVKGYKRKVKRKGSSARKRKGTSYKYVRVKGYKRKK